MLAAFLGKADLVDALIEAGADVNYRIPGERRKGGRNPRRRVDRAQGGDGPRAHRHRRAVEGGGRIAVGDGRGGASSRGGPAAQREVPRRRRFGRACTVTIRRPAIGDGPDLNPIKQVFAKLKHPLFSSAERKPGSELVHCSTACHRPNAQTASKAQNTLPNRIITSRRFSTAGQTSRGSPEC